MRMAEPVTVQPVCLISQQGSGPESSLVIHDEGLELLRSLGEYDEPVRLGTVIDKLNLLAFRPHVLQPRIDYLRGIGVRKVGRAVSVFPQLLVASIENNLEPKAPPLPFRPPALPPAVEPSRGARPPCE